MKQLLALLAAFLIAASSCGSDSDSTSALEALGFSADEAECYQDAYDTAGFDISEVLQANDLSDEDASTRDQIAADCSGVAVDDSADDDSADDDSADDDSADETGSARSLDDLSALEREIVEGMMADGVPEQGALCVVDAIQNEDIDLGQLLRAGDDASELLSPEMMTVVFSCMEELFDADSFSFDDFREPSDLEASSYGDNSDLDDLWDACGGGDGAACDELYWNSPVGSEYEEYGNTCGNRKKDGAFSCEVVIGGGESLPAGDAMFYGDDAYLDDLWDACADSDPLACEDLYVESPIGSEYEDFGATCGWYFQDGVHSCELELGDPSNSSAQFYGDNPEFDLIWDDCAIGNMAACDDLYLISSGGSDYEWFGSTCGGLGEPIYGQCVASTMDYGDDPYLDGIHDDCAAGNLYACDELYETSRFGSGYEAFGKSCGGLTTEEQWGTCAENFGT